MTQNYKILEAKGKGHFVGCHLDIDNITFFPWYNNVHRHSGVALYTPSDVHYGRAQEIQQRRQSTLDAAYLRHPKRFVRKPPEAALPPKEVWINPPKDPEKQVIH